MIVPAALVAQLLATASSLSGYPPPSALPRVTVAPVAEIAAIGCRGACGAQGSYDPQRGILLSDRLDPAGDVRSRAVLLHEIVHHLQDIHGAFADLRPCERFLARERQAYAVENRYLQRHGQPPDPGYAYLLQTVDLGACAGS
ncbi:hypothetical protein [Benzoatithermus flavus]|uniref:Uncharacterized protein n=1 Tax=Benzoatithermus flavus TaxID=3108223 RepID=A0ABU8XP30_9PROT